MKTRVSALDAVAFQMGAFKAVSGDTNDGTVLNNDSVAAVRFQMDALAAVSGGPKGGTSPE